LLEGLLWWGYLKKICNIPGYQTFHNSR
jgi:hypothetical protein